MGVFGKRKYLPSTRGNVCNILDAVYWDRWMDWDTSNEIHEECMLTVETMQDATISGRWSLHD